MQEQSNLDQLLKARAELDEQVRRYKSPLTILFTDIVGSTAYFERYGDTAGVAMVQRQDTLAASCITRWQGVLIKTIGDSSMAEFPDPHSAANAAIEMQRQLLALNETLPERERTQLRVGINSGVAFRRGNDIYGDAVNVAARIAKHCGPAQILVSRAVQEALGPAVRTIAAGKTGVHGKSEEIELYEIVWTDTAVYTALREDMTAAFARGDLVSAPVTRGSDDPTLPLAAPESLTERYEILEELGRGGMGIVYKARDVETGEVLALKVLQPEIASRPELIERFKSELRLARKITHKNVCRVYDLNRFGNTAAISMEYVQGESLRNLLNRTEGLPLRQGMKIILQVIHALTEAHVQGVVHRDLKPENILIASDGTVKLMDFGIARLVDGDTRVTAGLIGTPAYMSPEQATGKDADARSDVYSLGLVMCEILTARAVFRADSPIALAMQQVHETPPSLRETDPYLPEFIEHAITKCLEKDPSKRFASVSELELALSLPQRQPLTLPPAGTTGGPPRRALAWFIVPALVISIVSGGIAWKIKPPGVTSFRRFQLSEGSIGRQFALAPDGTRVAYAAANHVYIRRFDSADAQDLGAFQVVGGGTGGSGVFWSPDGENIAFASDGAIRRIPAGGGRPFEICKIPASGRMISAAWHSDGTIFFSVFQDGVYRVPESGGTPELFVPLDAKTEVDFHRISLLPDGQLLLNTHMRDGALRTDTFVGGKRSVVLQSSRDAVDFKYVAPGFLLFLRNAPNQGLWATPYTTGAIDLAKAVPVDRDAAAYFDGAHDGTLLAIVPNAASSELTWVDRRGVMSRIAGSVMPLLPGLSLSPKGDRAVFTAQSPRAVFVRDLNTGVDTRLTFENRAFLHSSWFPSGDEVLYALDALAFALGDVGAEKLFALRADGAGTARELTGGVNARVSRDGKYLISVVDDRGPRRLRYAEISSDGRVGPPIRIFNNEEPDVSASLADYAPFDLSPDDTLLAYTVVGANGQPSVFLTSFPTGSGRWVLSNETSASMPQFSADGRELFYISERKLMSIPIASQFPVKLGTPATVLDMTQTDTNSLDPTLGFSMAPDGRRFLMARRLPSQNTSRLVYIQNWTQRVDTKK